MAERARGDAGGARRDDVPRSTDRTSMSQNMRFHVRREDAKFRMSRSPGQRAPTCLTNGNLQRSPLTSWRGLRKMESPPSHRPPYGVLRSTRRLPFPLHTTSVSSRLSRTVEGRYLGNSVKAAARPAACLPPTLSFSSSTSPSRSRPRSLSLFLSLYLGVALRPTGTPFTPSVPTALHRGPLAPSVESRGLRDSHFDLGEPHLPRNRRREVSRGCRSAFVAAATFVAISRSQLRRGEREAPRKERR